MSSFQTSCSRSQASCLMSSFQTSCSCSQASCDSFCISDEITKEATQSLDTVPSGWVPGRFRLAKRTAVEDGKNQLVKGMHAFDFLFPPISWPVCIKALDGGREDEGPLIDIFSIKLQFAVCAFQ